MNIWWFEIRKYVMEVSLHRVYVMKLNNIVATSNGKQFGTFALECYTSLSRFSIPWRTYYHNLDLKNGDHVMLHGL